MELLLDSQLNKRLCEGRWCGAAMAEHGGTEDDKNLEAVKIVCQTVLMQGLGPVAPCKVVFAETRTVRLWSRVSEQIDAVKESWVTVAAVVYLLYGSTRVLKFQPQNRLLGLFGVKLPVSVWVACVSCDGLLMCLGCVPASHPVTAGRETRTPWA